MTDAGGAGERCILITRTCTTGMADWMWGELWLCPSGIIRRRLGWWGTIRLAASKSFRATVDAARRPEETFDMAALGDTPRLGGPVRWIPRTAIVASELKRGAMSCSLRLQLRDGATATFLWNPADGGDDLIGAWLPPIG